MHGGGRGAGGAPGTAGLARRRPPPVVPAHFLLAPLVAAFCLLFPPALPLALLEVPGFCGLCEGAMA